MFEQNNSLLDSNLVVLGVPYDNNRSGAAGAAEGPSAIAEYSNGIEYYSPFLDKEISQKLYYDEIDMYANTELNIFEKTELRIKQLLEQGKNVVGLCGDHSTSLPLIKAYSQMYSDMQVLQFDQHTDLRDEFLVSDGCFGKHSHASIMKRVFDEGIKFKQFGICSGTKEEYQFMSEHNTLIKSTSELETYLHYLAVNKIPLYITFDVDCLSGMLSTGTPGGLLEMTTIISIFKYMQDVGVQLVSFDINEYAPNLGTLKDKNDIAVILRELLLLLKTN